MTATPFTATQLGDLARKIKSHMPCKCDVCTLIDAVLAVEAHVLTEAADLAKLTPAELDRLAAMVDESPVEAKKPYWWATREHVEEECVIDSATYFGTKP